LKTLRLKLKFKGVNIIYLEGLGFYKKFYGRWLKCLENGRIHTKRNMN